MNLKFGYNKTGCIAAYMADGSATLASRLGIFIV
jgi:hypothetical protein